MITKDGAIIGAIIDVETTGLSHLYDEVIELGVLLFSYNMSNKHISIIDEYSGLREPSCRINPQASKVNGLTYNDVKNMQLDYPVISRILSSAEFIIAHNASFDLNFVTQIIPEAKQIPWYCSMKNINWTKYGYSSRSLQNLLSYHNIESDKAHRALADCLSLFNLLSINNAHYLHELLNGNPIYDQEISSNLEETAATVLSNINTAAGRHTAKSEINKALHILEGLIYGIAIDGLINTEEINELNNWLQVHEEILNKLSFAEIRDLIITAISDEYLASEEKEDIIWLCDQYRNNNPYFNVITDDIQKLHGIMHGILADNKIELKEIHQLDEWLLNNEHLSGIYPYDELCSLLTEVLKDGILSEEEQVILKVFFSEFIDTRTSYNLNVDEI